MVITQKLTPEAFISFPRRGPIVPNANGCSGLYNVSAHTIGKKDSLKEWKIMDLASGEPYPLTSDDKVHDVNWIPSHNTSGDAEDLVVWLRSADKGVTQVVITNANGPDKPKSSYVVGEIGAPVRHLKLKELEDGSVALAVVGLASEDGSLYNEESVQKLSTARIYDNLHVREVSRWPFRASRPVM
jgi:hypothetical protein